MKMQKMKFRGKKSGKSATKKMTFGVGGNVANTKFPNTRCSAMNTVVKEKPNTQTMGFNSSIPSR
jgi:hypothetical protein